MHHTFMHDITPWWLSEGRGVMNKKRKTTLPRGDTRCNRAVLCTSQRRKCLSGNVFHTKSPDKLVSLIIKSSLNIHSEFQVLRPERSVWSLWLWKGVKRTGHGATPLLQVVLHQAEFDSKDTAHHAHPWVVHGRSCPSHWIRKAISPRPVCKFWEVTS